MRERRCHLFIKSNLEHLLFRIYCLQELRAVSLVGDQLSGFAADTERDSQGAAPRMRDRR